VLETRAMKVQVPLKELADLISSISSIMLAALPYVLLLTFRREIVSLMPRIKKLSVGGSSIELQDVLNELSVTMQGIPAPLVEEVQWSDADTQWSPLSGRSQRDPDARAALLLYAREIGRELRRILIENRSYSDTRRSFSIEAVWPELAAFGLSQDLVDSLRLFLRTVALIEGADLVDEHAVEEARDAGYQLLHALHRVRAFPRVLVRTNFSLYNDADCTDLVPAVYGMQIEYRDFEGRPVARTITWSRRAFPANTPFASGHDIQSVRSHTWYIDGNGTKRKAFDSAAEFLPFSTDEIEISFSDLPGR